MVSFGWQEGWYRGSGCDSRPLVDESFLFSGGKVKRSSAEIRRATANDVPAVVRLWQEMMDIHAALDHLRFRPANDGADYWAEAFVGWLEDEKCYALVADDGGRLVGYIVGWLHQPPPVFQPDVYGFVSDICVAADCRQTGIGRRLFRGAESLVPGTWGQSRGTSSGPD